MESLIYSVCLTFGMTPTAVVTITIEAESNAQGLNCSITPSTITIPANDANNTQVPVTLETSGNLIDEGTNRIAYTCEIVHVLLSSDPQYSGQ